MPPRHGRLTKKRRRIFGASSRRSRRVLLPKEICMAFWVRLMQVWAKRPLLSPKDKKPWPCVPLPKIHLRAPKKRRAWRVSTLCWGMSITRFPFSSRCCRYRVAVRCFLLLQRCDSIRSGTKSATTVVFRNWPQKRNRDVGKIFAELAVCGVKEAFASRCDGRKNVRRYSDFSALKIADSSSTKAVSFSSARTTNRFPSPRCASATKKVRPRESTAETQSQLQPALLGLSAMISQYLTRSIVIYV